MDIDVTTLETELQQRLNAAKEWLDETYEQETSDYEGDLAQCYQLGYENGRIDTLNSLLTWLGEIRDNG